MKERTWLSILLSYAGLPGQNGRLGGPGGGQRGRRLCAVSGSLSILRLFVERRAGLEGILLWCGVCLAGYAVKVAGYALSTMLAHVSAYTILEAFASRWQISS